MFAYSCAKVNGTHLGTCIDRFYFGSCCKTQSNTEIEVNEPDNYLNNLDNDVAGPPVTTNIKIGMSSTDRYSIIPSSSSHAPLASNPVSTPMPYKPTTQFAVSSTTPSTTTTSRNQYTEISTSAANGVRPSSTQSSSPSSMSSSYSTTISQSTKPLASTTFSTVKPSIKPSSYKPVQSTVQKPKPQTAKPTVQFSVPSSTASNTVPYSFNQETTRPTATTSPYTVVTSLRPLNSSVTATFSTTKPVVKPSSTTYKSTTPPSSTTASPQKNKPQSTKPSTVKPKPSSVKPADPTSTTESVTTSYATSQSTVGTVTEIVANFTAATIASMNNQNQTAGYSSSTITSTSPTLVTWTTLDKVPMVSSENSKPPSSKFFSKTRCLNYIFI